MYRKKYIKKVPPLCRIYASHSYHTIFEQSLRTRMDYLKHFSEISFDLIFTRRGNGDIIMI